MAETTPMRLIEIKARNFKGLRLVEWRPRPEDNHVAGVNGSGKSSLLDAFTALILGPRFAPAKPIRDGELEAEVYGDIGEYRVTRFWEREALDGPIKSRVVVTSPEGGVRKRPQEILDGLMSPHAVDPLRFFRKSAKDQRDDLIAMAGLGPELERLDGLRLAAFGERTKVNGVLEDARARRRALPATAPDAKPVDVSAAVVELKAAQAANAAAREHRTRYVAAQEHFNGLAAEIVKAEQRLRDLRVAVDKSCGEAAALLNSQPLMVDTAPIESRLAGAEGANAACRVAQQIAEHDKGITAKAAEADALTAKIRAVDADKAKLLKSAAWPTPEIGIDDNGPTWNGVPLDQAATSEQLRATIALAADLKDPMKLVLIRDAALLTDDVRAQVLAMLDAKGVQSLWEEAVDDAQPADGVLVLEDGAVALAP